MTMLVWGSRYHWTLASTLLYVGFAGWAIGGIGAVIDSLIPINFRLHNTTWVVAHFHTYLILTVVVWVLAFLAHLLERDAGRTSSRAARTWTVALILVGGYGLTGTWFVEGVLGIPRRYAIQPPGTSGYSLVGAELRASCSRSVSSPSSSSSSRSPAPPGSGAATCLSSTWTAGPAATTRRASGGTTSSPSQPSRPSCSQRCAAREPGPARVSGLPACVVGLAAFFPQIVNASEVSNRYHHLDHAGQFFLGAMLGLLLGSLPTISRRLGERSSLGLAAVLAAPTLMMLVMVPRIYEPLERHPFEHALYHLAMAAFGLVTGLGATRLGLVTGRLMFVLSVGMTVMFAAAMK